MGSRYFGIPLDDLSEEQAGALSNRGYFKTTLASRLHPYTSYHCTVEAEIYNELGNTLGLICNISSDCVQNEVDYLCRLFHYDPKGINQIYGIESIIISLDRNEFINADQTNFKQPVRDAIISVVRSNAILHTKSIRFSYSINGVTEVKIRGDVRGNNGIRGLRYIEHLTEYAPIAEQLLVEIKHAYIVHLSQLQLSESV